MAKSLTSQEKKRPLRILLFSTLFPHQGEPTLGVFVRNRLLELKKSYPIEVTVVAPVPWFPFTYDIFGSYGRAAQAALVEEFEGITIYHPRYLVIPKVGMSFTPSSLARAGRSVIKKLLSSGQTFDLIDAHYLYPDAISAATLAKEFSLPFVATARGSDVTQIGEMPRPRARILEACKSAAHIITVSQSLNDRLVAMGVSADKISTLRNGIDSEKFHPVDEARAEVCRDTGLSMDKPIVLFAGWLIPRKRVDIVLRAVALLPDVQVLIVGDGPLASQLQALARQLNIEYRAVFVGKKAPDKMPKFFSAANLLCLPSEREGWANVMLEAMACGAPVVARAVDGALELITSEVAGRTVSGDNPEHYAIALQSVLDQSSSVREVRSYAEKFGWQSTSEGQMKIFEDVIR